MTMMKGGSPLLYSDNGKDILGINNPDGTDSYFISSVNSLSEIPANANGVYRLPSGELLSYVNGVEKLNYKTLYGARKGASFGGNYGRRIALWETAFTNSAGTAARVTMPSRLPVDEGQTVCLRLDYNATASFGQQATTTAALATTTRVQTSVGLWINNPTSHNLGIIVQLFNAAANQTILHRFSAQPTNGWEFFTLSGGGNIAGGNPWAFGVDTISIVRVGQDNVKDPWVSGDYCYVGTVYAYTKGRPRFLICNDDCTSSVPNPVGTTNVTPASGRSFREIVENYGFKGTLYCIPSLIGTAGYMTQTELLDMQDRGWSIGSHSYTHPSYLSRGLRSLGPLGYTDPSDPYRLLAANDDTAIYNDIMRGIEALGKLGISNPGDLFALPQGAFDDYVRSAVQRSGIRHTRGISSYGDIHSLSIGTPAGSYFATMSNSTTSSGWITQLDAVQTDGATTPAQVQTYIDECILTGATGAMYHHGGSEAINTNLDTVMAYLKTKSDAGLIDVMTVGQAAWDDGLL